MVCVVAMHARATKPNRATVLLVYYQCLTVALCTVLFLLDGDMQTRVLVLAEHHSYEREV